MEEDKNLPSFPNVVFIFFPLWKLLLWIWSAEELNPTQLLTQKMNRGNILGSLQKPVKSVMNVCWVTAKKKKRNTILWQWLTTILVLIYNNWGFLNFCKAPTIHQGKPLGASNHGGDGVHITPNLWAVDPSILSHVTPPPLPGYWYLRVRCSSVCWFEPMSKGSQSHLPWVWRPKCHWYSEWGPLLYVLHWVRQNKASAALGTWPS